MKNKTNTIVLSFISILLLSACQGDKKPVKTIEIGDYSFINKSFKGNKINYAKGMSACDNISANAIASLYDVGAGLVVIEDLTKSDRYKDPEPACMFFIKSGTSDFEWLRGSITVNREIDKDEVMGDVAEAVGAGKNWEEAWSLKKSISKSAEWIPNMGKAALWNARKKTLEIKFDGYNLLINPPKNMLNKEELARNRDYKEIAIKIAKSGGFVN